MSDATISETSSEKDILGFQLSSFFALVASPNSKSTSVGLKYRGSTFTKVFLLVLSIPFSFKSFPSQIMSIPICLKLIQQIL